MGHNVLASAPDVLEGLRDALLLEGNAVRGGPAGRLARLVRTRVAVSAPSASQAYSQTNGGHRGGAGEEERVVVDAGKEDMWADVAGARGGGVAQTLALGLWALAVMSAVPPKAWMDQVRHV